MSLVFQNIDPPPPSPHGECVPPAFVAGEDTLAWCGGEVGGGPIFWKTRDTGLPSYSNNLSTPLTNGFGSASRRPKTIRIRIRIRNTDRNYSNLTLKEGKNVKSQDSPVPRNASDMTGGQESRAPNTSPSAH
jgi:hypothetical protein